MNRFPVCCSILGTILAVGCGDDPSVPIDGGRDPGADDAALGSDAGSSDGGVLTDAASPDGGLGGDAGRLGCPRTAAAADRARYVVVSHPYDAESERSNQYEVLALDPGGELSLTGSTFEMGRAFQGNIAFTPDGEVGLAPQEDGTLGVFRLAEDGTPSVVHASYVGDFHAATIVIDPSGTGAWVLDAQWRENGGGIYRIEIGCDGTIVAESQVAPARLAYGMVLLEGSEAVVVSHDLLDRPLGNDVHVLDLAVPGVVASGELFAEDDWIVAGMAVAEGGGHVFVGDNASFSKTGNRIGVAAIGDGTISGVQQIPGIEDPLAIVASPFDDMVLVVSGFGDAILRFDYDPAAAMPLTARGELTYTGSRPALPGAAVMIDRGALRGLVLVAENVGVRRLRFEGSRSVTDLGAFTFAGETAAIVGALGVQP
jgi:hypothetical protein